MYIRKEKESSLFVMEGMDGTKVAYLTAVRLSKAKWCVDCLSFMRLKGPLGLFEKRKGKLPGPGLPIILRASMAHNVQ
jgi:hypothetical protein